MEVVEVKGGVAVLLSEYFSDSDVLESVIEGDPFVVKSDHGFNTFFTLLLERCGGGSLGGGVRCRCRFRTDCLQLLLWE